MKTITLLIAGYLLFFSSNILGQNTSKPPRTLPSLVSDKNSVHYNNLITKYLNTSPFKESVRAFPVPDSNYLKPVFTGSSTITRWNDLDARFAQFGAINRGIGGSDIRDIIAYSEVLIFENNPNIVVLYIGDNDIVQIGYDQFKVIFDSFILNYNDRLERIPLVLISIKPSPERTLYFDRYILANKLLHSYAQQYENIYYVNIWDSISLNPSKYFQNDSLHINTQGYDILEAELMPILKLHIK